MNVCPLTGYSLAEKGCEILQNDGLIFVYKAPAVGKAVIAVPTYQQFITNGQVHHPVLAGICRNAYENGEEPPLINTEFISGVKNRIFPRTFTEKIKHFLKYMYDKGGKDYREIDFVNSRDYPIAYAVGMEEFSKIIKHLEVRFYIRVGNRIEGSGRREICREVQLTDEGINEVEKELPKIPMIGLVNQEIATGDLEVDEKINHAKKLFFEEPQTMDNMRSACEALSYVLEPLRRECERMFGNRDTSDFFRIINEFDIRHNKSTTKNIEFPEQLEWVFYSLLNTINTYTKLKMRDAS